MATTTVQDREPVNSTVLWINVKLGLLPLHGEYPVTGGNGSNEGRRVVGPFEGRRARLALLGRWLIGNSRRPRRPPHRMESERRDLRLMPYLRLVWSRRENGT